MPQKRLREMLQRQFPGEKITAAVDERNIVTLMGDCSSWQTLVEIGHAAAKIPGVRNVVSDVTIRGQSAPRKDYTRDLRTGRERGVIAEVDVVIAGAGITGCGIARELARYDLDILVAEAGDDVASGSSRANNGCIHHGMDCKPGTLKSRLNILGNRRYSDWERELHIGFVRCGCLEIAPSPEEMPLLTARYEQGLQNGVDGIEMVGPRRAYEIEPALKREGVPVYRALYLPSHGLVETPYVCAALAENAAANGVRFLFDCAVAGVEREEGAVAAVVTGRGVIKTRYLINAAGLYADDIAGMAGDRLYTIHNRLGTLAVFDKATPPAYRAMVNILSRDNAEERDVESKGGGMNGTPERNLLVGPSAKEVWDKENAETTPEGMEYILRNCMRDPHNPKTNIIRLFAGGRPADFMEDFTIEMSERTDGFIHAACIQSPGIAAAPAIADRVTGIVVEDLRKKGKAPLPRKAFNPVREKPVEFRHLTREEQAALVEADPRYGRIVCRCEQVTEGEILDALKRPPIPRSVNAVKNRTRAGMGRCQGGFCQPRVLEILARELGTGWEDITLKGKDSQILVCGNRAGGMERRSHERTEV